MGRRWIKIEKEGVQFSDLNLDSFFLSFFRSFFQTANQVGLLASSWIVMQIYLHAVFTVPLNGWMNGKKMDT